MQVKGTAGSHPAAVKMNTRPLSLGTFTLKLYLRARCGHQNSFPDGLQRPDHPRFHADPKGVTFLERPVLNAREGQRRRCLARCRPAERTDVTCRLRTGDDDHGVRQRRGPWELIS